MATHYKICSAPTRYFSGDDIGKKFVRTNQWKSDCSYFPESPDISEIKTRAMELVEFSADYLKFRNKLGYSVILKRSPPRIIGPENWDDGDWISVDELAQKLIEGVVTIKAIHMPIPYSP